MVPKFGHYNTGPLFLVVFGLGVLGFLASLGVVFLTEFIEPLWLRALLSLIIPCSIFIFIEPAFSLIDQKYWADQWTNWLISVPDLRGRYEGTSTSVGSNPKGEDVVNRLAVEINQTGSETIVAMYLEPLEVSRDYTLENILSVVTKEKGRWYIRVIYRIGRGVHLGFDDNPDGTIGYCRLEYIAQSKKLKGDYFNSEKHVGTMYAEFVSEELKGEC